MSQSSSPIARLRRAWEVLSPKPMGKAIFSRLFGVLVPYTGSIRADVLELRPGYAKLLMRDRRKLRNHLNSVHAIALLNLAEATSGLAMNFGLPDSARAIVTNLSMAYTKKARGPITGECDIAIPDCSVSAEHQIQAVLRDAAGDVVATATATWLVGPRPTN
ncbi:MAG TPA: hotdog fold domain-containing protein [Oscillatoriaceae cyanobacterium]